MATQNKEFTQHRYEFVHENGADFVTYQRLNGDGAWQTFSTWMIPCANNG